MLQFTLNEINQILNLPKFAERDNKKITGFATSSKEIQPGNLFFALAGKNFDGHQFVKEAIEKGAVAAVVSKDIPVSGSLFKVKDVIIALGEIAHAWRMRFDIPLVAVTGSSGKTSVKNMVGSILLSFCHQDKTQVLITQGNLNNHIGVPLTLSQLSSKTRYGVVEMGMNHFGEIAYLTDLVMPKVGIVTNALPAHLEGVGDLPGVARAKGELFAHLPSQSYAVINQDDQFATDWRSLLSTQTMITFGVKKIADVFARDIQTTMHDNNIFMTDFKLHTPLGECMVHLPLLGQHNVYNALAAAAAGIALGLPLNVIVAGLENTPCAPQRLQLKRGYGGAYLIDDTYNANPGSVKAALESCINFTQEKILVLGDMGELGPEAQKMHREIAEIAKKCGFKQVYTYGSLSAETAQAFENNGFSFDDKQNLINTLKLAMNQNTLVLIKGSRSMRMEEIVANLV